jgi:type VI secretion system protein ImpL
MKNIMNDLINHHFYKKYLGPFTSHFLKTTPPKPLHPNPVLAKHLYSLHNRFKGALNFLANHSIYKEGKSIKLNQLPWYLVIGLLHSGKTSLLTHSSIHYLLAKSTYTENTKIISAPDSCDWWATRDAVLIDVPGNYTTLPETHPTLANKLWRYFLGLMEESHKRCQLNGIIITLSIADIMDKTQHEKLLRYLKYNIGMLLGHFDQELNFYIAITKCDLLPGFVDFFSDSSIDELAQAWGITLPKLNSLSLLPNACTQRFDNLIKRLNKQLIWRLHQEKHPVIKSHIKDFPLQIERLKTSLVDFLTLASRSLASFSLRGIYLTSANQPNTEQISTALPQVVEGNEFQQALSILREPAYNIRPYFIKQFLLQALSPTVHTEYLQSKQYKFRLIYTVIALATIALSLTWLNKQKLIHLPFAAAHQTTYSKN